MASSSDHPPTESHLASATATTTTTHLDPATDPATDPAKPAWYSEAITIPPIGRQLLSEYSHIPASSIDAHVSHLRDRAFAIFPYPCIGQYRFLHYKLPDFPYYRPTLAKLRDGGNFVDVGCCFGQVLRYLKHFEKVPDRQLFGFDLEEGFIGLGHELFKDGETFGGTMVVGDLLREREEGMQMNRLEGEMDVVHVASVFHVFGWEDQVKAAKRIVSLTRPVAGSMIHGSQTGSLNAGEYVMPLRNRSVYRHNEESMRRFWKVVGDETGTEWKVDCANYERDQRQGGHWGLGVRDPGFRMIWFSVVRV